jgi:hypothetical protein
MKKAIIPAFLLVLGSTVLGATVLQERLAWAAPPLPSVFVANDAASPVPAREQNVDADGNIKVHEQGTSRVRVEGVPSVKLAEEPFGQAVTLAFHDSGDRTATAPISVPPGKLLAIEYVSTQDNYDATLRELQLRAGFILASVNAPVIDQPGDLELVSEEVLLSAGSEFGASVTAVRDALAPPGTTEVIRVLVAGTLRDA